MKIQDSSVQLAASHEESQRRSTEITGTQSFRQILADLARTTDDKADATRKRVQRLLQSLVEAILAAIDGKKGEENFAAVDAAPPRAAGGEMRWTQQVVQTVRENERTDVCGKGCVRTADGRQIAFDFSLNLARDDTRIAAYDENGTIALRDPLVISFDGKSSELSAERIAFDLDADGRAEEIPGLGQASGYLVFDRNGNGKAGDGFADLAQLDGDHNGWIDENDAAWSKLGVWSGEGFAGLAERRVGALYTGAVAAPFSLKSDDNALLGQIREAGFYLAESGEVGHLQHVDLAVSAPADGQQEPGQGRRLTA